MHYSTSTPNITEVYGEISETKRTDEHKISPHYASIYGLNAKN